MKIFWLGLRRRYYLHRLRRKNLPPFLREYVGAFAHFNLEQTVSETEFVVLDTETTGLDVKKGDRILSISSVRLKRGRIDLSDTFHQLVNPNRDIPAKTAVVHEILPRMVNEKPTLEEVLPDFLRYIGSSVLVAHHQWLDMSFLDWEMVRCFGFPIQNIVLDTALLDQALALREMPVSMRATFKRSSSLASLAERYKVSIDERHSSFWDALATAEIFQKMIKEAERRGIRTLRDLVELASMPPSFGSL